MDNLIGKEQMFMGVTIDPFLLCLYWLVAILTLGFIAVFIIRLANDMRNSLTRFRKRIVRVRR
jgi:hypothetical protein